MPHHARELGFYAEAQVLCDSIGSDNSFSLSPRAWLGALRLGDACCTSLSPFELVQADVTFRLGKDQSLSMQSTCLAFRTATWVSMKHLTAVAAYLRHHGTQVCPYLDNWLVRALSFHRVYIPARNLFPLQRSGTPNKLGQADFYRRHPGLLWLQPFC